MAAELTKGAKLNVPFAHMFDPDTGTQTQLVTVVGGGGGGGSGVDRELVVTAYRANKVFTGASVGDLITATRMVDVSGANPSPVGATIWRNETTNVALASAPASADIDLATGGSGISNAEMTILMAAQNDLLGSLNSGALLTPSTAGGLNGVLRGIWANAIGRFDDAATTTSAAAGTLITKISGLWKFFEDRATALGHYVQGSVASGATDSGNPVKIGGVYQPAVASLSANQRGQVSLTLKSAVLVTVDGNSNPTDGIANTAALMPVAKDNSSVLPITALSVFNGTSWDRMRGTINGLWTQGNVAHNGTDAGNPVKVGGVYTATPPALVDGRRSDLQVSPRGSLVIAQDLSPNAVGDTIASTSAALNLGRGAVETLAMTGSMVFDPLTSQFARARGNANGALVQGNVASGVADVGNPVKIGGVYTTTPTTLGENQRGHIRIGFNGAMLQSPNFPTSAMSDATTSSNFRGTLDVSNNAVITAVGVMMWDGTWFNRMRGTIAGGLLVDTLKAPLLARSLAVSATSNPQALTAGTNRVSIYARGCDLRYAFGAASFTIVDNAPATGTAVNTHFLAAGERVEVPAGAWIAVISDSLSTSRTGTAEVSELA